MKHLPRLGCKARAFFVAAAVWAAITALTGGASAGEVETGFSAEKDAGENWAQEMSLSLNLNWAGVFGGEAAVTLKKEWPWNVPQQGSMQVTGLWTLRPEETSRVGLEVNSRWEGEQWRLAGTAEFSQRLAAPGTRMGVGVSGELLSAPTGNGDYRLWQWQGEMVYRGEGNGDLLGLTWLDNAVLYPWPGDREAMFVQDPASLVDLYAHWLQVMDESQETGRVRA